RVLDVNTGTGIWVLEMATACPNTLFLGIDTEKCFPQCTMPPNCRFECMNIFHGLDCASELFDYVHIRLQLAFIPTDAWQQVLLEMYRITSPGGWIEVVEWDAFYRQGGPISNRMTDVARQLLSMRACDPSKVPRLDGRITDAGYTQVTTRAYDIPLGRWGGSIGLQMMLDIESIVRIVAPNAIKAGLFGPDEVPTLLNEWEKEMDVTKPFVRYYVYTGQRPNK
ncbi:S-adenosyl-L-methionine-dependent methyltransferase, partial [Syncephalis plumigaleata]